MKKQISILLFIPLLLVAFCSGVYYGFNTGVENYYHLDKIQASNIDVLRAKDLRGGSDKELKYIYWEFEMSINEAIDSYTWYHDSGNHLFSKLFLSSHLENLEKSIKNIASYRQSNPLEDDTESLLCKLPEAESDKEHCVEMLEKRREIVKKYVQKS